MNAKEIKAAVLAGKVVYWVNGMYQVVCDACNQWFIVCNANGHAIGLTWRDGVTLNGEPEEFYTPEQK